MKLARRLQTEEHTDNNDVMNATSIKAVNVTRIDANFTEVSSDTMNVTDTLEISENYEQQDDKVEHKKISKRSIGEHIGLYYSLYHLHSCELPLFLNES